MRMTKPAGFGGFPGLPGTVSITTGMKQPSQTVPVDSVKRESRSIANVSPIHEVNHISQQNQKQALENAKESPRM